MPAGLYAVALLAGGLTLVVIGAEAFVDGLLSTTAWVRVFAFFSAVLLSGPEVENIGSGPAANLTGFLGAATGTFLGGTTFFATGMSDAGKILAPYRVRLSRSFWWVTALAGTPLLLLAIERTLSRMDGAILFTFLGAAMFSLHGANGAASTIQPDKDNEGEPKRHPWAWLQGGLAALTFGGEMLGHGLQAVVSRVGISATLFGNTAIAALTEAEEKGRIAVPARRGQPDMSVANVSGKAIHLLTLNAGILAVVVPLQLDDATMRLHLPVAVAAPAISGLILHLRGGLGRREGLLLSATYVAYIATAIASA